MALTYANVEAIIESVPPAERDMPALVVGDDVYTWNQIRDEIKKKSPLAEKILIRINELKEEHGRNKV